MSLQGCLAIPAAALIATTTAVGKKEIDETLKPPENMAVTVDGQYVEVTGTHSANVFNPNSLNSTGNAHKWLTSAVILKVEGLDDCTHIKNLTELEGVQGASASVVKNSLAKKTLKYRMNFRCVDATDLTGASVEDMKVTHKEWITRILEEDVVISNL